LLIIINKIMKTKRFLGGLALGAVIGSALGLFLSPDNGKKNREKFKKVAASVSEKLVEEVTKLDKIGKKEYDAVVENIVKKYSKDDLMSKNAWLEIMDELKLRYKDIQKEMKEPAKAKKTIKPAKKVVKKASVVKKSK